MCIRVYEIYDVQHDTLLRNKSYKHVCVQSSNVSSEM